MRAARPSRLIWIRDSHIFLTDVFPIISITYRFQKGVKSAISPQKHVIHRAVQWKKMLKDWDAKSLTEIAKVEGIGQPRVSQIMNLLNLPPKVQEFLLKLEDPEEISKYSERRLREFIRSEGGQGKTRISIKKLREFIAEKEALIYWKKPGKHIIHQAVQWREMLEGGEVKSLAEIAKKARLTRARVTQIMNLLKLPEEVQEFLLSLNEPEEIRKYSEKRLRENPSFVEELLRDSVSAVSGENSKEMGTVST